MIDPRFPFGKPTNRDTDPPKDPPIPGRKNWYMGKDGKPYYVEPPPFDWTKPDA